MELTIKDWKERMEQGIAFVLVTILEAKGSTPRRAGSMMLIDEVSCVGTIGGGKLEYLAQQTAKKLLKEKRSQMSFFLLNNEEAGALGMACGGSARLLFSYVDASQEKLKELLDLAYEYEQRREQAWLCMQTDEQANWNLALVKRQECVAFTKQAVDSMAYELEARCCSVKEKEGWSCFVPIFQEGTVYLFGGGHVSKALAPVLKTIFFHCVVIDDLEEFSNFQRFPDVDAALVCPFEEITKKISFQKGDYAVIVTRGHLGDYVCVKQLLHTPMRYIGMIGSKKKREYVYELLREDGFTENDIARIHSPIGLPIGGGTPEEIAISIAAELILERSGGKKR